jgi:hypothetical protein
MALTITDTSITSDAVPAHAEFRQHAAADGNGAWVMRHDGGPGPIPGYRGRLLDRDQAISAMTIEEEKASPTPDPALIASLEIELR